MQKCNNFKIGMILDIGNRHFPPDIRVEKEARSLCFHGFHVSILTTRFPQNASEMDFLPNSSARIIRKRISVRNRRYQIAFDAMTLLFPSWYLPIREYIEDEKPNVLHVHDLLMVPTTLHVAKKYGIPVVADLHENMPAAMRAYRANLPFIKKLKLAVIWNYRIMRVHESRALHRCANVIVVVPEAASRMVGYGIPEDKVIVVSNTEDETTFKFDLSSADPTIMERYKGKWVASYIGGIGPHRGVDTALNAAKIVLTHVKNFRLLIVGATKADEHEINMQTKRLGIESSVEVIGWEPFERVNTYVLASDVCLVPHRNYEHTQTTVPHKLFQYMICRKPVLVSDCRPLMRIVKETDSGRVFKADDSESLASNLLWMHSHSEECRLMGERGAEAALGRYAWREDAKRLVRIYRNMSTHGASGSI